MKRERGSVPSEELRRFPLVALQHASGAFGHGHTVKTRREAQYAVSLFPSAPFSLPALHWPLTTTIDFPNSRPIIVYTSIPTDFDPEE